MFGMGCHYWWWWLKKKKLKCNKINISVWFSTFYVRNVVMCYCSKLDFKPNVLSDD